MNLLKAFSLILLLTFISSAQMDNDLVQFKGRIGFGDEKEKIEAKYFSQDGTKVTLIGLKEIQTWDIAAAKLVESHPHEIAMLDKFNGMAYEISPDGSKIVTLDSLGSDGSKKEDRVNAYAYDVKTGKRIAVLERPDYSVRFGYWTADGETFVTFSGIYNQKQTEISFWNGADFSSRNSVVIEDYSWHQLSPDGKRIYIGNGGRYKILGISARGASEGKEIRAFDLQTGKLVKTFDDDGAGFEVQRGYTFLSPDGKFIAAVKNKNTLVWDANGGAKPVYELTAPNGKNRMRVEGFSDDAKYLFIRQDGKDEYYDATTGKQANDVSPIVKLRRENDYFVPAPYNFYNFRIADGFNQKDSVQQTPDGRYAVVTPCDKATVFDLTTDSEVFKVGSECHGGKSQFLNQYDLIEDYYHFSEDVFRLSPRGKFLVNFRYSQFVVRDIKTGTVLQRIKRDEDKNLQEFPKWNLDWDFKGNYALTTAKDEKSMLIWKINES